jgi:hypothetical protein
VNSSEKTGPRAAPTQSHVASICRTRHGGSSLCRRRSDQWTMSRLRREPAPAPTMALCAIDPTPTTAAEDAGFDRRTPLQGPGA